ncbi:phosphopantetheine-binding protein [Kutzneria kofuensis]|uniref:Carrier domain-containing protein n=1 Tax=Kutzneria kofuensis TaxID=103725 RepID=A0A7W9NN77_9PSEU|nr:acyl carrier protein [Kutzneria kofuensis]MBB5898133.1 hypothetical protein [Kutzneria kofuensis]
MTDPLTAIAAGATDPGTLTDALMASCRRRLAPRDLTEDDGFFEAGLTSMKVASVVVDLKRVGVPVALLDFFQFQNVRLLAVELSARMSGAPVPADDDALPWDT